MGIFRLNHAVLYVSDVTRSTAFYCDVLGFRVKTTMPGAAFLQASNSTNDHDLGLFQVGSHPAATAARVGLYHLAWEVDTLEELRRHREVLSRNAALVGASDHGTTKSLYARDPDGIEFEVVWIVPAHLLDADAVEAGARISPLDLESEIARYGGRTPGGIGISVPVGVPGP